MSTSKHALIIGASRGLGLGLVQRLREDGWNVTATVRDAHKPGALADVAGVRIESLEMNDTPLLDGLTQRSGCRAKRSTWCSSTPASWALCLRIWKPFKTKTLAPCS